MYIALSPQCALIDSLRNLLRPRMAIDGHRATCCGRQCTSMGGCTTYCSRQWSSIDTSPIYRGEQGLSMILSPVYCHWFQVPILLPTTSIDRQVPQPTVARQRTSMDVPLVHCGSNILLSSLLSRVWYYGSTAVPNAGYFFQTGVCHLLWET